MSRVEDYSDKLLSQGKLLKTRVTDKWSPEEKADTDFTERCSVYSDFHLENNGRTKKFICIFNSPEDAEQFIYIHNKMVTKIRQYKLKGVCDGICEA
ncbi:hypothetical protein TPMD03_20 [Thiohalocapsa phage LS06-2018-MD03]|nr:hypothetical protein TPMD03_20 [Thiohalocapsa phage LS06-2018-MD03]